MPEPTSKRKTDRSERPVVEELPPPAPDETPAGLVCNVAFCPICMAVTAARGAAPDAIDHLIAAAREFFLAARAVLDVRADDLEGSADRRSTRLEKIDIG